MPPDRFPPDDPREWLNRARSNLAQARLSSPDVYLEDRCFNAQQAAEKALKALLLSRRARFARTHSLSELVTLLTEDGVQVPREVVDTVRLTVYAVAGRYPGPSEPVTPDECDAAIGLAGGVVVLALLQASRGRRASAPSPLAATTA